MEVPSAVLHGVVTTWTEAREGLRLTRQLRPQTREERAALCPRLMFDTETTEGSALRDRDPGRGRPFGPLEWLLLSSVDTSRLH